MKLTKEEHRKAVDAKTKEIIEKEREVIDAILRKEDLRKLLSQREKLEKDLELLTDLKP